MFTRAIKGKSSRLKEENLIFFHHLFFPGLIYLKEPKGGRF